ncbi:MAG: hypothetical protein CMN30_33720 [Sandaracinus sp.]|nr:hypothetical protein [Sandaracinus sp.]|tara:strand:- start:1587 stop:1955 length:369 start_codon:yes stop_codon:yes gene_type:complete
MSERAAWAREVETHRKIRGRRWRVSDPRIPEDLRQLLVDELMDARRAVGAAKRADDAVAERAARDRVHDAKVALGERGVEWWAAEVDEAGRADRRDRARRVLERRTPGPKWTLDDAVEAIAG